MLTDVTVITVTRRNLIRLRLFTQVRASLSGRFQVEIDHPT
jgi:hypothetical protein